MSNCNPKDVCNTNLLSAIAAPKLFPKSLFTPFYFFFFVSHTKWPTFYLNLNKTDLNFSFIICIFIIYPFIIYWSSLPSTSLPQYFSWACSNYKSRGPDMLLMTWYKLYPCSTHWTFRHIYSHKLKTQPCLNARVILDLLSTMYIYQFTSLECSV